MARMPKIKPGQYFSAPLLGGGYGYGYFTHVYDGFIFFCDVFDRMGDSADLPADIDDSPLLLTDMAIGGEEFTLKPEEAEEFGGKWVLHKAPLREGAALHQPLRIMGTKVVDLSEAAPDRPATPAELDSLGKLGHPFPPTTHNMIEVALRRLDVDPDDFYPKDFPKE